MAKRRIAGCLLTALLSGALAAAQSPVPAEAPKPLRERLLERAERGEAAAQFDLAVGYETGRMGLQQDFSKAQYWYQRAADQGEPFAAASLGILYNFGKGVERDYFQALVWYERAASRLTAGDRQTVIEMRDDVAGHLTPGQIAEAQRMVKGWPSTVPHQ